MSMMDKKYIPERDFEAASVDLLRSRDTWRERAQEAEEKCAFLTQQLEEAVAHGVAQEEAVRELVTICQVAVDKFGPDHPTGFVHGLVERMQELIDKHAQ